MTDETLTELNRKIAAMQAYRDGKEIEILTPDARGRWCKHCDIPRWNWETCDYRVKPVEPQKLVGLRYRGETVHSAWHDLYRAGVEFNGAPDAAEKVEFIELTPEVRAKLNL